MTLIDIDSRVVIICWSCWVTCEPGVILVFIVVLSHYVPQCELLATSPSPTPTGTKRHSRTVPFVYHTRTNILVFLSGQYWVTDTEGTRVYPVGHRDDFETKLCGSITTQVHRRTNSRDNGELPLREILKGNVNKISQYSTSRVPNKILSIRSSTQFLFLGEGMFYNLHKR